MEYCVLVEGQVFPKEHLQKDEAEMLKDISLAKAKDRQKTICSMVRDGDGPFGYVFETRCLFISIHYWRLYFFIQLFYLLHLEQ
jgi:hypothetical protein